MIVLVVVRSSRRLGSCHAQMTPAGAFLAALFAAGIAYGSAAPVDQVPRDLLETVGPTPMPITMCSISTCGDLGWVGDQKNVKESDKDSKGICGASDQPPLAGCSGLVDQRTARRFCEDVGARLCTK